MQGNANKEVIRTFAVDGSEITVRGSRYDLVKMMPPVDETKADAEPFDSAREMSRRCGDDPNLTIIDRRDIGTDEKAGAWMESGWPEQANTYDR